ncbi:MAG TPA: TonB-dependent receptor [Thermoanaerobaculaceae bacterium]|nr:TonB-dependent receptor [Thermoanaerobaculaceae bacterium]
MEHVEREPFGDTILCARARERRTRILVVAVLAMAVVAPGLWAQTTATIQGTIADPSNVPLVGVEVLATGAQGVKTVMTDEKGFYRIPNLPPGSYELIATLQGYAPGEFRKIQLQPGQTLTLNVTLTSLTFTGEVLVTSEKRTEPIQTIPISITALSSDALEGMRVENLLDVTSLVPGLSVEQSTPGQTRITLRGINTGGVASTVGVYLDDVPFGSSSGLANGAVVAGDFDTFDVARIEVLRGPQGTLYGASSLGGVFKYITNAPTTAAVEARFLGSTETVQDGGLGYSLKGLVNVPLSDQVALRASGFYRFDDGFINSIGNNPIPSLTTPGVNIVDGTIVKDKLNSFDSFGGRLSALFAPSKEFSLLLTGQIQDINSDAPNIVDADPTTVQPLYHGFVQSRYQSDTVDTKYRVFNATLKWDFGAASLESVTSYATFEQDIHADAAIASGLTGGPPLASVVTYYFGNDVTRPLSAVLPQTTSTDKWTEELRLLSPASQSFEWLIGGYFTKEDSKILQKILAVEAGTDTVATDIPILADLALPSSYKEFALFANATWHISSVFDLSFGARTSKNEQVASQTGSGPLVGGEVSYPEAKSSETPFTYSISPRFELAKNSFLYVRVATGFRPGGPNVLPAGAPEGTPLTYNSDSLTSYEAGWKTSGSNGRYSLDLSAYYLDWKDIQLLAVVNGFGINGNGGTAVSQGAEFTLGFVPTGGLSLSLNGAYTDGKLTQDTDPIVGGLNGDPLPFVPKWGFGLSGDYEWKAGRQWTLLVGAGVGYVGERTFDFVTRQEDGSLHTLGSYTTVDLRAGAYFGPWSFELYGRNLTNERGVAGVAAAGGLPNGALGLGLIRPRTVGVSVGVRVWGS